MEQFINQILAGIATGSVYACLALAIVMIYVAIDHVNFAQGEMAMVSTYIAWQCLQWGMPYWLAAVLAVALSFVAGIVIERTIFRPLGHASVLVHIAGFVALFMILNSVAGMVWGFSLRTFPTPFGTAPLFGGMISSHQSAMIGITFLLLAALFAFFRYTRVGLSMRAAATMAESARLVGINVGWMIALGWGLAAGIGAIAGLLIAPVVFLEPNMMAGVLVYGFAGAVLGGLDSPPGAVFGGLLVGVMENMVGTYIPGIGDELKLPIALVVIVTVLVVKPRGLFGAKMVERV